MVRKSVPGKKRTISRRYPESEILARPSLKKEHLKKPQDKKNARKAAWDLAREISKLKTEDKATFHSPEERKAPVLVSQNTEERMFVFDSGASMHMLSKKDLSSDEMDTFRRSRTPATVATANGEVQTSEEAQVYVYDLDLFVTVQLLDETPAVLSLGKLCSEHGCSYEWKNGETSRLTKNGTTITCIMDNIAPLVVPRLSSSSSSSSASTSRSKDQSNSSSESETSSDHQIQSRLEVPSEHAETDADRS